MGKNILRTRWLTQKFEKWPVPAPESKIQPYFEFLVIFEFAPLNAALEIYVGLYNSKFSINWEKMSSGNYWQQSGQPFFVSANQRAVFYFAFKISTNHWNDCFNPYLASVWAAYQVTIKNFPPNKKNSKNLGLSLRLTPKKFFFRKKF